MSRTRTIDIHDQKNLTLTKTFGLCVTGVLHRLIRSVLTLAVVVLAVAFFMFLLSENMFVGAVAEGVAEEVSEQRLAARLLNRLFNVPSSQVISRRLSDAYATGSDRVDVYAAVTGWDAERVERLAKACRQEQIYLKFFEGIPLGKRVVLVRKRKGRQIFRVLTDLKEKAVFEESIKQMPDLQVPGEMSGFRAFLHDFTRYAEELEAFTEAWRSAIESFVRASDDLTGAESIEIWLSNAGAVELNAWQGLVCSRGFQLDAGQIKKVQIQLRNAQVKQKIVQKLSSLEKRALWHKTFREHKKISTEERLLRLNDERVVRILDNQYDTDQLAGISDRVAYERRLFGLERRLSGKVESGMEGQVLSERQIFLLFISFIVCMVGIANAMLMSITERFREIATMKCLGATDRYILVQFMLEAALQGVVGGAFGMIMGFVIALVKNAYGFGSYVFTYWPGHGLIICGVFSMGVGILLAMLASIYPSWAASRMAPMDAMRVE